MGECRTLLFAGDLSAGSVLDAIRKGRTVSMDRQGRLYGPPELVRLAAPQRPVARTDPIRRIAVSHRALLCSAVWEFSCSVGGAGPPDDRADALIPLSSSP